MKKLLNAASKAIAKQRRKSLSNEIFSRHNGEVQLGAYKGLKLQGDSNVSRGPLGLKIFGLYETQVVNEITASAPFTDLINLGAADGYMSLGPLFAGLCDRSICFEMTEEGRNAVQANAEMNGVAENVVIRGIADETLGAQLNEIGADLSKSVILCDIEGAEFDVLTEELLAALKNARIIVELHDRVMPGGLALREALIARIPEGNHARILKAEANTFNGIEELERMHDIDRSLVLSDGRKIIGEWLVIEPAEGA